MRIGIYLGPLENNSVGGGKTFQDSIINGLMDMTTQHEFYFYYRGNINLPNKTNSKHKFINLSKEYSTIIDKIKFKLKIEKRSEIFTKITDKDKIDFVYYVMPSVEKTDCPYLLTVWDLGHKVITYFPEVSISGWTFDEREAFYNKYLRKASYVMIGNNTGKNQIAKYYGFEESRIITNPMITPNYIYNTEEDVSILEKNDLKKDKYIFYPAQFWPHKNHIRIIKAMSELKKNGFKVVFTGSDVGNMTYIKEKAKEYGVEDNVIFLVVVNKQELIALYKNAFALVYASMLGPDNIPPLEAMALKCPVICADYEGAKEQLKDCALYFNPIDENEMIQNINYLKNENIKQNLTQKGEELAKTYNIENYLNKIETIFDNFSLIRECWSSKDKYVHL